MLRASWPIAFLIPLSWWANRGCQVVGVDPLYHTTLWIHERLGWFVIALALLSAAIVVGKIVVARRRFAKLQALSDGLPSRLSRALDRASRELAIEPKNVLYIDIATPIASVLIGGTIVFSRGFVDALSDDELVLVVRHELAHVAQRDANMGALWHLAFAALLVPGFEPLERRLYVRREFRANLRAAHGREEAYLALVARAGVNLCAQAQLGLEVAARRPEDRFLIWLAPIAVLTLAIALPLSHFSFQRDLPYLLAHHC